MSLDPTVAPGLPPAVAEPVPDGLAWHYTDGPGLLSILAGQTRATRYGIAPYLRLTGCSDGSPVVSTPAALPIRAVAVSPSPNGAEATASVRQLLAAHGLADVPVVRSRIPFRA